YRHENNLTCYQKRVDSGALSPFFLNMYLFFRRALAAVSSLAVVFLHSATLSLLLSLAPLSVEAATRPSCNGQLATIWVNQDNNHIMNSTTDSGVTYAGTLNGGNGSDVIVGTAGNDIINGNNGNDTICGGAGNDTIDGGNGSDTMFGEDGDDRMFGGNAGDTMTGGNGNDFCDQGNGPGPNCEAANNEG